MKKFLVGILILCVIPYVDAMEEKEPETLSKARESGDCSDHQLTEFMGFIIMGNYEKVVELHKAGAPVNGIMPVGLFEGYTALMIAASYGDDTHIKIAEYLLDNGAEIDGSLEDCKEGIRPPICIACNGRTKMVELLLKRGAKIQKEDIGVDLLAEAYSLGKYIPGLINMLIDAGCTLSTLEPLWLIKAAQSKVQDMRGITFLIKCGIDFETVYRGKTYVALCSAARHGLYPMCKLLLRAGADPHKEVCIRKKVLIEGLNQLRLCHNIEHQTLLEFCATHYRKQVYELKKIVNLIKSSEDTISTDAILAESYKEYMRVVQYCESLITSQEVRDIFEGNKLPSEEAQKEALAKLKNCIDDGTIETEDSLTLEELTREEIVHVCCRYQKATVLSLVTFLKGVVNEGQNEFRQFLQECEKLRVAQKMADLFKKYLNNPLPLKCQCINRIRDFVKKGKLLKKDLPKLEEFGFDKIIVPQGDKNEDNNNNNNEDEK